MKRPRYRPTYYPMGMDPAMGVPQPRTVDELRDMIDLYTDILETLEKKAKEKEDGKKKDEKKPTTAPKFNFLEVLGLLFPAYFILTALFKAAGISL